MDTLGKLKALVNRTRKTACCKHESDYDENKVRDLAYLKWEQAGGPETNGEEFWLAAEQELYGCKTS